MTLATLFALIIASCFAVFILLSLTGCGSSGGSSNPASPVSVPSILNVSPTTGSPGTQVTIQGTGFGVLQGTSTVTYAGVTLIPNAWSNTQIVVTIPSNAVTGGAFIINVGGQVSNTSTAFTITDPQLTSVSPASGLPGSQVTLTGRGFGTTQGRSYVSFNGQIAQITTWSDSYIVCIVPTPTNTSPGSVSVVAWIDSTKSTNALTFTIQVPTISTITSSPENAGAQVSISGTGFGVTQGQVFMGGQPATIVSWSETNIQARIPTTCAAGSSNVSVQVTVVAQNRTSLPYSITIAPPSLDSMIPNPLKRGEILTISGNYFGTANDGSISIWIDGILVSSGDISRSDTSLSIKIPSSASTGSNKTVRVKVGEMESSRSDLQINLIF